MAPKSNAVLIIFALVLISLVGGLMVVVDKSQPLEGTLEVGEDSQETLTPSTLLNRHSISSGMAVRVRGKIYQEMVVCEKAVCPIEDNCCGCPAKRDLLFNDAKVGQVSKGINQLRLTNDYGEQLCAREKDSCKYTCQGAWQDNNVYDITGIFSDKTISESGINFRNDYSLIVRETRLAQRLNVWDTIQLFVQGVAQKVQNWRSNDDYVVL